MGTIVVGVDGSVGSDAALRWALAEARLRGTRLRVVHAYEPPPLPLSEAGVGAIGSDSLRGREIERAVVEGAPAQTLIESARGADLLVLGSRGRGGFLGLLLGSVSQQCAQHPPCPVVILPPSDEAESDVAS